jgi:small subunit ribosomal protein S1
MDDDHPINTDNPPDEEPEENFAEMFESYSAGMNEDIQVGDKIHGKIISISDSAVFVDTGTKADGVVDAEELKNDDGELPFELGDTLALYVVAATESEIRLSKAIAGIGGLNMLKDAYANQIPVEGKVVRTIKGGLHVEVLKRRAFCPVSQIDTQYVEDAGTYVGQTFQFRITRLTDGGRNIVLSRRDLMEAEMQKSRKAFMRELAVDQIYTGHVTRVMPYGAFVELVPGVEGMVHVSELSWSRVDTPDEMVGPGDQIDVKVLRIEPADKQIKIALSVKQISGNPWDRLGDAVCAGQKMTGKVIRCAPFGAFVEIMPGIEGLVHISEMSYTKRVVNPQEIVKPGQSVAVMIKAVDLAKRRISLSIRDAEGDPWLEVEDQFSIGQRVTGTVEKKEKFGIFVALSPGIVGLLPKSVIKGAADGAKIENFKPGAEIEVVIVSIQAADRRISLGIGGDDVDSGNWRQYCAQNNERAGSGQGALGDKLAEALRKKK